MSWFEASEIASRKTISLLQLSVHLANITWKVVSILKKLIFDSAMLSTPHTYQFLFQFHPKSSFQKPGNIFLLLRVILGLASDVLVSEERFKGE